MRRKTDREKRKPVINREKDRQREKGMLTGRHKEETRQIDKHRRRARHIDK